MTDYKVVHLHLLNEYERDRTNPYVLNQLAIACMEINDYHEAFRLFRLNAELNPGLESFTNMAYFYFHEGEPESTEENWGDYTCPEKAIRLLERVLALNPKSEIPSALLGEVMFAVGKWTEAKKTLEFSVQINATFENLHNLGSALSRLGHWEEALEYFMKAHQLRGEHYNYQSLYNYVCSEIQLGHSPNQAIIGLENARANEFSEVDADSLAGIYYELHQYFKVVEAYEHTKLYVHPKWVLPYCYSLLQCKMIEKLHEVKNKALERIHEQLQECEQDDDESFTLEERLRYKE